MATSIRDFQAAIPNGMNGAIQDAAPQGLGITATDDVMFFTLQGAVLTDGVQSSRKIYIGFATTDVGPGSDATYDAFTEGSIIFAPGKVYRKDTAANAGTNTWTSAALA